jgi:hypothetical protein
LAAPAPSPLPWGERPAREQVLGTGRVISRVLGQALEYARAMDNLVNRLVQPAAEAGRTDPSAPAGSRNAGPDQARMN